MPEYLPKTMELFPNFYSIPGWIAGRVLAAKSSQIIYKWQLILQRHKLYMKWVPTKSLKKICIQKNPQASHHQLHQLAWNNWRTVLSLLTFLFRREICLNKVRVWFNDHFSPLIFTHKNWKNYRTPHWRLTIFFASKGVNFEPTRCWSGIEVLGPLVWVPAPFFRRDSPNGWPNKYTVNRADWKSISGVLDFCWFWHAWANSRVHGI